MRVLITPRTRETVLGLTPRYDAHREIMALLRLYLGCEGEAHLEMLVRPELMPEPVSCPQTSGTDHATENTTRQRQYAHHTRSSESLERLDNISDEAEKQHAGKKTGSMDRPPGTWRRHGSGH